MNDDNNSDVKEDLNEHDEDLSDTKFGNDDEEDTNKELSGNR